MIGELDLAIADFASAYSLDSKDAEAHCRRGLALQEQQREKESRDEFVQAAKVNLLFKPLVPPITVVPPSPKDAADIPPVLESPFEMGLAKLRESEAAALAGETAQEAEFLDAAIRSLTVAIQANNKNADAYFYRGVAYARKKEADSAAENFKQALERRENFFSAHLQLARLYCGKGQHDDLRQAVEFASRAVRLKGRSAEAQRVARQGVPGPAAIPRGGERSEGGARSGAGVPSRGGASIDGSLASAGESLRGCLGTDTSSRAA